MPTDTVMCYYRLAPIVDKLKESHHKMMRCYSSAVTNEIELLRKCLDALFENKIYIGGKEVHPIDNPVFQE